MEIVQQIELRGKLINNPIGWTIKSELLASATTHTNSLTAGAPPNKVPIRTALL